MFGLCLISRKGGHYFLEAALGSRLGEWERFISFCQGSIIQPEYFKSIHFLQSFQGPQFCFLFFFLFFKTLRKVISSTQHWSDRTGRSRVSLSGLPERQKPDETAEGKRESRLGKGQDRVGAGSPDLLMVQ